MDMYWLVFYESDMNNMRGSCNETLKVKKISMHLRLPSINGHVFPFSTHGRLFQNSHLDSSLVFTDVRKWITSASLFHLIVFPLI